MRGNGNRYKYNRNDRIETIKRGHIYKIPDSRWLKKFSNRHLTSQRKGSCPEQKSDR